MSNPLDYAHPVPKTPRSYLFVFRMLAILFMAISGLRFSYFLFGTAALLFTNGSSGAISRTLEHCTDSIVPFALACIVYLLCREQNRWQSE